LARGVRFRLRRNSMFVNHLRPSRLIGDDLHEFVLECRRRNVGRRLEERHG
jgi:hypothetical protein